MKKKINNISNKIKEGSNKGQMRETKKDKEVKDTDRIGRREGNGWPYRGDKANNMILGTEMEVWKRKS